jgi:NADPH2:quinone reductase
MSSYRPWTAGPTPFGKRPGVAWTSSSTRSGPTGSSTASACSADIVVDPVGADRFLDSVRLLRPEGRLVVVGFAGGEIPQLKVNRLLLRNITVMGAAWREFLAHDPGFVAEAGAALSDLVANGRLTPLSGTTYPLEDGAQALRDLAARRAVGKLVLTVR